MTQEHEDQAEESTEGTTLGEGAAEESAAEEAVESGGDTPASDSGEGQDAAPVAEEASGESEAPTEALDVRVGIMVHYRYTADQNLPAIVTNVFSQDCVNLKVINDYNGPDTFMNSVSSGNEVGQFTLMD